MGLRRRKCVLVSSDCELMVLRYERNLKTGSTLCQSKINPILIPRVTASVRLAAPNLAKIELMWNLTV